MSKQVINSKMCDVNWSGIGRPEMRRYKPGRCHEKALTAATTLSLYNGWNTADKSAVQRSGKKRPDCMIGGRTAGPEVCPWGLDKQPGGSRISTTGDLAISKVNSMRLVAEWRRGRALHVFC